ncbi:MAG: ferritin [Candidatus Hydrogenedentales bacterium]
MLKRVILDKLNEQLNHELQSAYVYYAMAGYFEGISLKGFAHWMTLQAQEELTHVNRLFRYINDKGARVALGDVPAPKGAWKSPLDAIQDAYNHECFVSEKINECVSAALAENDHSTNTFLQWFVAEQVEEEAAADDVVQKLKLIGDHPSGLFMLDNELSKRTLGTDPAGSAE